MNNACINNVTDVDSSDQQALDTFKEKRWQAQKAYRERQKARVVADSPNSKAGPTVDCAIEADPMSMNTDPAVYPGPDSIPIDPTLRAHPPVDPAVTVQPSIPIDPAIKAGPTGQLNALLVPFAALLA